MSEFLVIIYWLQYFTLQADWIYFTIESRAYKPDPFKRVISMIMILLIFLSFNRIKWRYCYVFCNWSFVSIIIFNTILISIAISTYNERKILVVFRSVKVQVMLVFYGILQPFSDALKLLLKETFYLFLLINLFFIFSPIILLSFSLVVWLFILLHIIEFFVMFH